MTLGAFWSAYHTPISLAIGPLLAYCIFRWLKIHPAWKIGLLLVAFNGAAGEVSTAVLGVLIFLGGLAERIAIAIEKDG